MEDIPASEKKGRTLIETVSHMDDKARLFERAKSMYRE